MNLEQGTSNITPGNGLSEMLNLSQLQNRPLRVKFGIDPTGSDLTLGHAVVLRKLRQFQDAGHQAVLIIGDFTAQVGDPTGRSATRSVLSAEETKRNAETYLAQALKVLSQENLEVHFNSSWLNKITMAQMLEFASLVTVAQLSTRNDFATRLQANLPVALSEFFYPLLQAIDSVEVKADIELGGSDQLFNLMLGRELQKAKGQNPQLVMTMPILEGLDGVAKMSKSLGNFVAITEPANEQFGKLMSIPDTMILRFALLCSPMNEDELTELRDLVEKGGVSANKAKRWLARSIVESFHPGDGDTAESAFNSLFVSKEIPTDVKEFTLVPHAQLNLLQLMLDAALVPSKAEAKRLLKSGAVRLDGVKMAEEIFQPQFLKGKTLQVGKRKAVRLI